LQTTLDVTNGDSLAATRIGLGIYKLRSVGYFTGAVNVDLNVHDAWNMDSVTTDYAKFTDIKYINANEVYVYTYKFDTSFNGGVLSDDVLANVIEIRVYY
jgi:hypothetical protein